MMRKLFVLAMVGAMVGLGGFVRDASAGSTVDLLFVGHNGGPIPATDCAIVGGAQVGCHTVAVGDTLTMAILMTTDETLSIVAYSLEYDLDGDNELDVVSAIQWSGVPLNKQATDFFSPINPLPAPNTTFIGSFQGAITNIGLPRVLPPNTTGLFSGGYQMGTVVWKVNAGANTDGADIISGLLNGILDGWYDGAFNEITELLFHSASVNLVPEPGTASLLGLGLVGLVLMGRRSRS